MNRLQFKLKTPVFQAKDRIKTLIKGTMPIDQSLLLYKRLAGYQANASALVADRIVEHVISFVGRIPDERNLMGVFLVQPGRV